MKVLYVIPGKENGSSFIFSKREFKILQSRDLEMFQVFYLDTKISLKSLLSEFLRLRNEIKKSNISIVHAQYGTITAFISLLASFRLRLVITFRGSDINGSRDVSIVKRTFSVFLSWVALPFADHIIFVSENLKKRCMQTFGDCSVIGTGVDLQTFFPLDRNEARNRTGIDTQKSIAFIYSSFNSPNKRYDLALGAIEFLKSRGEQIEILEIKGNISPEKMPLLINASDVVLMLSDFEGSPTVVQEAIACGVPVVSVEVGDTVEKLKYVKNSVLVDRNFESIGLGILKAFDRGRVLPDKRVLNSISLENCIDRILEIYSKLK